MKSIICLVAVSLTLLGIKKDNVMKGKVKRLHSTKREYIVIFDFEDDKTATVGLIKRGDTLVNWHEISLGDSIYYQPQIDTFRIKKLEDDKIIKIYFKNRTNELKL